MQLTKRRTVDPGFSDPTSAYPDGDKSVAERLRRSLDSVYRFKGQQAGAVVLVDIDPRPAKAEQDRRVLSCGMTRAMVRLEWVVQANNPAKRRLLAG